MLTILHIITGLNDGGAEAVLYRLCSMDKQNSHIVVSMMDEGKYGPLLKTAGVELHCLGADRGKISHKSIRKLWRILRDAKPDIVQTWMYHANLIGGVVAYLSGAKRIIWGIRHVHLTRDDSKFSTRLVDRMSAFLSYWVPKRIVAISNKVSEAHIARGYADKFTLIYNGCDTSVFCPGNSANPELLNELGLKGDVPIVGCVARWTPEKDHVTFLKAVELASRERQFQVILVGAGCVGGNDALSEIIKATGTTDIVTLAGPRDDIPAIMNLLDLHVLPSRNEAFGNVLIEAMACGTPCVSTRVGDAAHILGNSGWIVEPRDHVKMAQCIVDAIAEWDNHDLWKERQINAQSRVVEIFSIEKMVGDYRTVWRDETGN